MTRSWLPGVMLVMLLALPALSDDAPKMEDVAGKLACYCGTCPHLVVSKCGCSTADQIKADVLKMIKGGMTEQQILDSYVAQYGQTVLAAPTRSGFNLTAWLVPFLAFAFGGLMLFRFLKRQQSPAPVGPSTPAETPQDDDFYRELMRKELEMRR